MKEYCTIFDPELQTILSRLSFFGLGFYFSKKKKVMEVSGCRLVDFFYFLDERDSNSDDVWYFMCVLRKRPM